MNSCLLYSKGCYSRLAQSNLVLDYFLRVAEYLKLRIETSEDVADFLFNINAQAFRDSGPSSERLIWEVESKSKSNDLAYDFDKFTDPTSVTQVFTLVDRVVYQASSLMLNSHVCVSGKELDGGTIHNILWNLRFAVANEAVHQLREARGVEF